MPHENRGVSEFSSQGTVSGITCERDDLRLGILCHPISPALVGISICGYASGVGGGLHLDEFSSLYGFMAVPAKN